MDRWLVYVGDPHATWFPIQVHSCRLIRATPMGPQHPSLSVRYHQLHIDGVQWTCKLPLMGEEGDSILATEEWVDVTHLVDNCS